MHYFNDGSMPSILANRGQYISFDHLVSRTLVSFRAFVTQFEDQFTSEWNEEHVFGRMDPIATFKRTGRKINLGWEVIAESGNTAKDNLRNIAKLIRMLYPSYDGGGGMARSGTHISGPPLMRLKFMNLVQNNNGTSGLLGYVDGFTNSPILEEGFIETESEIFPRAIQMSCTFTVLHTHALGWDQGGLFRSAYSGGTENHGSIGFPYALPSSDEELALERAMATATADASTAAREAEINASPEAQQRDRDLAAGDITGFEGMTEAEILEEEATMAAYLAESPE